MMLWAMKLPSTFGQFWPDGDFEGEGEQPGASAWFERLRSYHRAQPTSEQERLFDYEGDHENASHFYAGQVSAKFRIEVGTRLGGGMPPLTPIEPHEPPASFDTVKTFQTLGSLIMLNSRIVAINRELKNIIEGLEPEVHQFFPIEIRMPKGVLYPDEYFTLSIRQYFDSFSPELSKPKSWRTDGEYSIKPAEQKSGMAGMAFSSAIHGSAHLWRERRLMERLTFFSDTLKSEIEAAELRIPALSKVKAVC